MESKTIDKNHQRSRFARLLAVQGIFQLEQLAVPINDLIKSLLEEHPPLIAEELKFTEQIAPNKNLLKLILVSFVELKPKAWELIKESLPEDWQIQRLEPVLRAILLAAVTEFLITKTPKMVVISEYMSITNSFFSAKEPAFVNGILDSIARKI